MAYYVLADTHLGHDNLQLPEYCNRPADADSRILRNTSEIVKPTDILIHLGDVCIGSDRAWHDTLWWNVKPFKKWLIKGNHDRKSYSWYLNNGWDFVANSILLHRYGVEILLTHEPVEVKGDTYNVHGHCHNATREGFMDDNHKLVMMEHDYRPYDLQKLVNR